MVPERKQLLLPFQHQLAYDSRDFVPAGSNEEALAWLETDWPDRRLALWGTGGCGKSHLLHVWAARTGANLLRGQTLGDLNEIPESGDVVLDDADTILDEPLLLHLLNTARDRGLRLLLSGQTAPSRWRIHLPDLSSRLRAITAVEIRQPNDELLAALLMRLLADRQLLVPQAVQDWLLLRLPRYPAALREAVARLDRASLTLGSGITRALAAKVLAEGDLALDKTDEVCASQTEPPLQQAPLLQDPLRSS
jgi:chromosomal replication initiation ATPase DnaA